MASLNKVMVIGACGRDPDIRSFPSGDQIATVSVATTEKWKDKKTGEKKEHTEWVNVVFSGGLVGVVESYLKKGSQIYVEGKLRTRKWTDKNGVEKYTTEVRADQMQMLGSKADRNGAPRSAASSVGSGFDDMEDDIPF